MKLGPTGTFPHGKLTPHDEGGLNVAITHDGQDNIHINFGKKISWFAMPKSQAIDFALLILKHCGFSIRINDDPGGTLPSVHEGK